MQAARPVASLALDAWLGPGPYQAWQVVLVRVLWPGRIAGGVAWAAVVWLFDLASVITHPARLVVPRDGVGKVVLGGDVLIYSSDDETILVNKASLPVIAANDVGDVIPGIVFGQLGERIGRRLTVHHGV